MPLSLMCVKITHMGTVKDFAELGARVRQVRMGVGLDQSELAGACGLERSALSRIESGYRKVSALELSRIAEALKVSLVDLVAVPEPDVVAARKPVGEGATPKERKEFRAELELDRAWRDLCQLREAGLISPAQLSFGGQGVSSREQAQQTAREVRSFLAAGDEPLEGMADVAAEVGLWIRTTKADIDGVSMTPEPGLGVALVYEGLDPGRRRTTVAHEIGHHVFGDTYEAAGHYNRPAEGERLVDDFAAELLLPQAAVRKLQEVSRDALVDLAASYRVSWSLVIKTARILGLDLSQVEAGMNPADADFLRVTGALPGEDVCPPGLARPWIKACATALEQNLITPARASEMTAGVLRG